MVKATDIVTDDGDLVFSDGDFAVGLSDERHIEHILIADKGTWRNAGALGVGLYRGLQGGSGVIERNVLRKKIYSNLRYDGYRVLNVSLSASLIVSIDAERLK